MVEELLNGSGQNPYSGKFVHPAQRANPSFTYGVPY